MSAQDIIKEMINDAPAQSGALSTNISQIQDQINDFLEKAEAIEEAIMDVSQADLTAYLEITKIGEVEADYGSPIELVYGPTFGTRKWTPKGNISDWKMVDSTTFVPVYVYEGVGWDDDDSISIPIEDYSFANDYLYRPLTDGATYGLYPLISSYTQARNILQENKDKIDNSVDVFNRYI